MTPIEKKLVIAFIDYKKRQGKATSIVFQSLPERGVWLDDGFYPYKSIIDQFKARLTETKQNDAVLLLLTKGIK